ncbi:hypothetical protein [Halococcus sp. IIIV-5B]|uniref:hypothetical protein n=1 Tax=Halococcus sp. IIIV-5B TaxID=2321230 RepID=UPI000E71085C|nr:hypothetical protein [Halococcus sp. IIIV-5B]RJT07807.1 hypothetical protein D3261_00125 [Halococcus sp. IIIV-5B]
MDSELVLRVVGSYPHLERRYKWDGDFVSIGGSLVVFSPVTTNGIVVITEFTVVKVRTTRVNAFIDRGTPSTGFVQDATRFWNRHRPTTTLLVGLNEYNSNATAPFGDGLRTSRTSFEEDGSLSSRY